MKEYLGDAVYAEYDERDGGIRLTTEDGVRVTNEIHLEPMVMATLNHFYIRAKEEAHANVRPTDSSESHPQ